MARGVQRSPAGRSNRPTATPAPAAARYDEFVEHPRYGRHPRYTGLDPDRRDPRVHVHWNAIQPDELRAILRTAIGWVPDSSDRGDRRVPGTAIVADPSRQRPAMIPVTHYYDVERCCAACGRRFLFFALEQRHWYEELRFPLEADARQCPVCRKKNQALGRARATYERLVKVACRTEAETRRLLDSLLLLVEHAIYSPRLLQKARALGKQLPAEERAEWLRRVVALEQRRATGSSKRRRHARPGHTR